MVPDLESHSNKTEDLLGIKIRFENYTEAHTHIVAVKEVYLGGPAHISGMQPESDFIVGTEELTFSDINVFAKYL